MKRPYFPLAVVLLSAGLFAFSAGSAEAAIVPDAPQKVAKNDYSQQLNSLVGKQSQQEIIRLVTSPGSAELLYDPLAKRYVAAIDTSGPSAQAISFLAPGCNSTSACVWTGSTPNGYTGVGTLTGSWKNVGKFASGSNKTTMWSGQSGWQACPNKTTTFTSAMTFSKMVRDFAGSGC
jgi:hypothetical protein